MNPADWVIIMALGASSLISIWRGFVKEAMSLTTWVSAVLAVYFLAIPFSGLLESRIDNGIVRLVGACLVLFLGTILVGSLVGQAVGEMVKVSGLGGADRFLGIFFGLLRGALIVLLILAMIHYTGLGRDSNWWKESLFIPEMVKLVEYLAPHLLEKLLALLRRG